MRRAFGWFGLVATVILLAIVGAIAYNIGWSDGINTHLPAGTAAAPAYYYGPHLWGAGFGIFGLLWFLFLLFVFFGVLRLIFFGFVGRRMWKGGWGYGRGFYGHGYGVPPAMDEKMREWHRRAHGDSPAGEPGASSSSTPPPPPPDQRTV